jgi:signal transduction histidine kinase
VCVTAEERGDSLRLSIRDDGAGGADPARGSGLMASATGRRPGAGLSR